VCVRVHACLSFSLYLCLIKKPRKKLGFCAKEKKKKNNGPTKPKLNLSNKFQVRYPIPNLTELSDVVSEINFMN